MNNQFTVIILAGGLGTRLGDLTKHRPKSLMSVCNKPIIEYSLVFARALCPEKIVVVGGYMFDQLSATVAAIDKDVVTVEDKDYIINRCAAGLMRAHQEIKGGFIVYNGDYIYHQGIAKEIQENFDDQVRIFGTSQESNDIQLDMMVKVDKRGNVVNLAKGLTEHDYYFNSLLYCPQKSVSAFFASVDDVLKKDNSRQANLEAVILEYAFSRGDVKMVDLGYPRWVEIDTPEELAIAERLVGSGFKNYQP